MWVHCTLFIRQLLILAGTDYATSRQLILISHGRQEMPSWSTGVSTIRHLGSRPSTCIKIPYRHMLLVLGAGRQHSLVALHGNLVDTILSASACITVERCGASTTKDGGCFDFRMGVIWTCIFDDNDDSASVFQRRSWTDLHSTIEKRRLRTIKTVHLGSLAFVQRQKRSFFDI